MLPIRSPPDFEVSAARHRRAGATRELRPLRAKGKHSLCRTIVAQARAYHCRCRRRKSRAAWRGAEAASDGRRTSIDSNRVRCIESSAGQAAPTDSRQRARRAGRGRRRRVADRGAALPGDRTGWTVHRDVALRLKNISASAPAAAGSDPGEEIGAFKIRLAGSLDAQRDASFLVQQRYASKGYRTSATRVNPERLDLRRVRRRSPRRDRQPSARLASRACRRRPLSGGDRCDPPRRAQGLRIHPAGRGRVAAVAAGACRAVPHGVPVRTEDPRLRLRRDRSEPQARRVLPEVARLPRDRRRAPQSARGGARGAARDLVCGHRRSSAPARGDGAARAQGKKPLRVRILPDRGGRSAAAGSGRCSATPGANAGSRD